MSRHTLDPHKARHEVVVGWDPPLNTFFAQVLDTEAEDDLDYEVLWIGTSFDEVPDPARVIAAVQPFAAVPDGLLATLQQDRIEGG